jgi:superfamily I DNA/RNA helicase
LLPNAIGDVDGNAESRRGTVSVFDGPPPSVQVCASADAEQKAVAAWIAARVREGYRPEEIGVFVRSDAQLDQIEPTGGHLAISTMHLAKGLEFRAVAVMACDDEVLPLQERIEAVADDADLEEVYNTERHLLYVACTRARDNLLVTGITPGSEFLADIKNPAKSASHP